MDDVLLPTTSAIHLASVGLVRLCGVQVPVQLWSRDVFYSCLKRGASLELTWCDGGMESRPVLTWTTLKHRYCVLLVV